MINEIKEYYKITNKQAQIAELLIRYKTLSIPQVCEEAGVDRFSAQRFLNKLIEKNIIKRRQKNLERGYCFIYSFNYDEKFLKFLDKKRELLQNMICLIKNKHL